MPALVAVEPGNSDEKPLYFFNVTGFCAFKNILKLLITFNLLIIADGKLYPSVMLLILTKVPEAIK